MKDNLITLYTDGSCNPEYEIGAWAVVIFVGDIKIVLSGTEKHTTHQRMELIAVIKAFEYLAHENYYQNSVELYTDSQYVVGIPGRSSKLKLAGFRTSKARPIQNADLVQELIGHLEKMNVIITKVKAHLKSDQNSNREVDMLSRKMVREMVEVKKLKKN